MTRKRGEDGVIPSDLLPLTAEDVATALGCSVKTVYELGESGEIPGYFRVGRLVRFKRRQVLGFLGQDAPSGSEDP